MTRLLRVQVAMPVSVMGFPMGMASAGVMPIWTTGHVASEPELDYQDQPAFLINATTRQGMSGSPVVLRHYGPVGVLGQPRVSMRISSEGTTRWLGVYSGRIHGDAELVRVWRPEVVREVISHGRVPA